MHSSRWWRNVALPVAALVVLWASTGHGERLASLRNAQRLLDRIRSVDGAGSGLDADTVRGLRPEELGPGSQVVPRLSALEGRDATLEARNVALEQRVAALEKLLASVSLAHGGTTVRFSGVNVQIVSGAGRTNVAPTNGLGNLIVGYNELRSPGSCNAQVGPSCDYLEAFCNSDDYSCHNERTGSHNIIAGSGNNYTSFGGIVTGQNNSGRNFYGGVIGGEGNEANGWGALVTGGFANRAQGFYAVVSGGERNNAVGDITWVGGGERQGLTLENSCSVCAP